LILEEIYQIIDNPSFVLVEKYDNKVAPLFKAFGDEQNVAGQYDLVKIAQTEIDAQNFVINDNKLGPTLTGTNDNGEYVEYPSLKTWTDDEFNYLIKRQKQTKNPNLKAKYSHILWLSPKKHLRFATDALTQYRKIIRELNSTVWDNDEKRDVHILRHTISNAFHLAVSTSKQSEIEKIKKQILPIIKRNRLDSDKTYINIGLIQLMLNNPKVFKQIDFKNLEKSCLNYAQKQTSLHSKIDILRVAEKVSNKLSIKNSIYQEQIAKAYEDLSHQREDGTNIAAISFCQDAIKYYKKLKNSVKVKELEERYKHLKQTMQLRQIKHEFDLTETVKELKKIADEVLKKPTDYIISFLMYSPMVFPPYQLMYDEAMKQKKENSFQFLFGTVLYDEFGHTSAYYNDEEEKIHFAIMQSFGFKIRISSLILLHEIIFRAVEKNKISSASFLNFIRKNSWLGQDITITYKQGEANNFNWLQTLAPGINDFFSQIFFLYQNPLNIPNFVLAIDSLSIKIEGILRDICELRGVTTFFQADDGKGRNIVKEKDINALLREETIKNTLSKDDLMLMQFLLVDKVGWNLRNRVAHTLIRNADGYGLQHMLLLIVVILKLAKNEYGPPRNSNETFSDTTSDGQQGSS
jgi:Domain of unknown function (DUF4209)